MRLFKKDIAPEFSVTDLYGKEIQLKDYQGKKVLLCFFRGASCPFCNLRVHELIQRKMEFDSHNIEVIMFFTTDANEITSYMDKQKPTYTIIPDPNGLVYREFGVEESLSGKLLAMFRMKSLLKIFKNGFFNLKSMSDKNTVPADILLDESGIVEIAYYGRDFGDHLPFNKLFGS